MEEKAVSLENHRTGLAGFLTNPTPSLKDIQSQTNSQLLSVILLTMMACFSIVDIVSSLTVEGYKVP